MNTFLSIIIILNNFRTPFHADVFSSFSWSANICGKKRWRLFPPGEENYLRDRFGNLVYDVESEDLKNDVLYPEYNHTVRFCELIQKPGEAIFIPSGWHHQVWNLVFTFYLIISYFNCLFIPWKSNKRMWKISVLYYKNINY